MPKETLESVRYKTERLLDLINTVKKEKSTIPTQKYISKYLECSEHQVSRVWIPLLKARGIIDPNKKFATYEILYTNHGSEINVNYRFKFTSKDQQDMFEVFCKEKKIDVVVG